MKTLLFLVLLTMTTVAQDFFVADSLVSGIDTITIGTKTVIKDSIVIVETGYALDMGEWYIVGKDTGASYTDSIKVYRGSIRKNPFSKLAVDTLWTQIPLKDPSFEDQTIIAAANSTTVWIPMSQLPKLLKLEMVNAEVVSGRKWEFVVEGTKNK